MRYVLNVDFGPIWDSVEVVKSYRALVDECNALGRGEREKVCRLWQIRRRNNQEGTGQDGGSQKEAAEFVQGRLAENNKKFLAEIDKQVLLDGDQISLGDMELLRSELVANENELKALQVRHASSPAMRPRHRQVCEKQKLARFRRCDERKQLARLCRPLLPNVRLCAPEPERLSCTGCDLAARYVRYAGGVWHKQR